LDPKVGNERDDERNEAFDHVDEAPLWVSTVRRRDMQGGSPVARQTAERLDEEEEEEEGGVNVRRDSPKYRQAGR
jgi:hypothetical protein